MDNLEGEAAKLKTILIICRCFWAHNLTFRPPYCTCHEHISMMMLYSDFTASLVSDLIGFKVTVWPAVPAGDRIIDSTYHYTSLMSP